MKLGIILIIIGVAVAGAAIAVSSSFITTDDVQVSNEPLKIAKSQWPGDAYYFIAQEKGFFEKNGVDVELIFDIDYTESQQRFANEEVDGASQVLVDTIYGNFESSPSKVVFVFDYSTGGDSMISLLDSVTDLKGKTIGVEGIHSFSHLFAIKLLEKYGLTEEDVFFTSIASQDALEELENGNLDAAHVWEPITTEAVSKGYNIIGTAGEFPYIITDVLIFNQETIDNRSTDIQAVVKSLFDAQDFLKSNPDEAYEIMAKHEQMSVDALKNGVMGVEIPDLDEHLVNMANNDDSVLYQSVIDIGEFYVERGQISSIPLYGDIIEPKFVLALSEP